MLSIFPTLLAYGLLAPFIIRIALGAYFLYFVFKTAQNDLRKSRHSPFLWGVIIAPAAIGSVLVLSGILTQVGAFILALWTLVALFSSGGGAAFGGQNRLVMLFALVMALSLLVSGAGFLAFDMPL